MIRRWIPALLAALASPHVAAADPSSRALAERALAEHRAVEVAPRLVARGRRSRRPRDLYWAARLLEVAGQKSSALERYLQVVLAGQAGGLGPLAARRLAQDPGFPLASESMARLVRADLSALDGAARHALLHRLALFQLRTGDLDGARLSLEAQGDRAEALYLGGMVTLRQGQPARARRLFERAVERARRPGLLELGHLALARLALESGRVEQAGRHYTRVPFGSPHFFRAQQELAWVNLQRGRASRALAASVTLAAPSLNRYCRPDAELVEAAALLALCRPEEAAARARVALSHLDHLTKSTAKFLRERPDARLYYVEAMVSAVRRSGELDKELVKVLLADSGFRRAFRTVRQLQRERGLLLGTGAAALRRELSAELDRRLVEAQEGAGRTVQGILTRLQAELKDLRLRARELLFDLEGLAAKGRREERERRRPVVQESREKGRQLWPFQGEHWSDEIGHYRVSLPGASSCR